MGFCSWFSLPKVCDMAMSNTMLKPYRERTISRAEGRVLEIGQARDSISASIRST